MPDSTPAHAAIGAPDDLLDAIATRWSPRSFADRSVSPERIRLVLEAARWAPSSSNTQPWRYVVARREEKAAFADLLACLNAANQAWARHAPVLMLGYVATVNPATGKPLAYALHDMGAASALLSVQAAALGLQAHQMAGIVKEEAAARIKAPEGFEFKTALALGYPGPADRLPDDLAARETAPRVRRELSEFVFGTAWGEPAAIVEAE